MPVSRTVGYFLIVFAVGGLYFSTLDPANAQDNFVSDSECTESDCSALEGEQGFVGVPCPRTSIGQCSFKNSIPPLIWCVPKTEFTCQLVNGPYGQECPGECKLNPAIGCKSVIFNKCIPE